MKASDCFWYGRSWTLGSSPAGSDISRGYTCVHASSTSSVLRYGSAMAGAAAAAAGAAGASFVFHACRACCHTCLVCVAAQCESHCGHLDARSSQT